MWFSMGSILNALEDSFNDDFWLSLDGICNALDNMEAEIWICPRAELGAEI